MTKRIAYVDCFSGASGDMLLGALLDAGLDFEALQQQLATLGLTDYELSVTRQARQSVSGCKFDVHDHGHDRPARNLLAVQTLIEGSTLAEEVKADSLRVFTRLAEAEARVHGTTVDQVHFHEVGAVDTLIDVVGFCWGLHSLEIEVLYVSALPVGGGIVHTEHGLLPVPAPATLALLAEAEAPLLASELRGELVTPTGAALLTTLGRFGRPALRLQRVGYGLGSKEFPWPNILRIWIGEPLQTRPDAPFLPPESSLVEMAHAHAHPHPYEHEHQHGEAPHEHRHEP